MTVEASRTHPAWAIWQREAAPGPYSLGVEEEVMLLDPDGFALAHRIDNVLPLLSSELAAQVTAETHGSALELRTNPQASVAAVTGELRGLREQLRSELEPMGLRAASAGTHPFAVWHDTVISGGDRYQFLYGSMRELARREPTFALHIHVGVPDEEDAIRLVNRLRAHLPVLLALSVNSPFWQGRDSGLGSARTPLFQAFPRVGIPRQFAGYEDYVETVDLLIRCQALPEPTFLWWDIRPQPRFGTVEVRIMDVQTTVDETAALVALVQSLAALEVEQGFVSQALLDAPEVLAENRFLAARDGIDAELIDPALERRVPARRQLEALVTACAPYAERLGCAEELRWVPELGNMTGAQRQRAVAERAGGLPELVAALARAFCTPRSATMARLER